MKVSVLTTACLSLLVASATAVPHNRKPEWHKPEVFEFTSTYSFKGTPDKVVNGSGVPTGGLAGSWAYFNFGINTYYNTICYNITLYGFKGDYQSPAITATHIHNNVTGYAGPPRLAFPDPVATGNGDERVSFGCLTGPFKTGVKAASGADQADGFHVRKIEENPKAYYADIHSSLAVPGAMRGQLGWEY